MSDILVVSVLVAMSVFALVTLIGVRVIRNADQARLATLRDVAMSRLTGPA